MKSPIIRAENTIDAPRLREYGFIFKIKYGFWVTFLIRWLFISLDFSCSIVY